MSDSPALHHTPLPAVPAPVDTARAASAPPLLAIITPSTLAAIGLRALVLELLPSAKVSIFQSTEALRSTPQAEDFFHYFVSPEPLMQDATFYLKRRRKVIVLISGGAPLLVSDGFHTLTISQDEGTLRSALRHLACAPAMVRSGAAQAAARPSTPPSALQGFESLTPREREVMRLLVMGRTSREAAQELGIGMATVLSHRKNLTHKLHTRSLATLALCALSHGLVSAEEV